MLSLFLFPFLFLPCNSAALRPHQESVQLARLHERLTKLHQLASSSVENIHSTWLSAEILRVERQIKRLQSQIWMRKRFLTTTTNKTHSLSLYDLRDLIKYHLYTKDSLPEHTRKAFIDAFQTVMKLLPTLADNNNTSKLDVRQQFTNHSNVRVNLPFLKPNQSTVQLQLVTEWLSQLSNKTIESSE